MGGGGDARLFSLNANPSLREGECVARFYRSFVNNKQRWPWTPALLTTPPLICLRLFSLLRSSYRDRQTDRQRDRDRDRERQRETERQRQRQTETDRDIETQRETETDRG